MHKCIKINSTSCIKENVKEESNIKNGLVLHQIFFINYNELEHAQIHQ